MEVRETIRAVVVCEVCRQEILRQPLGFSCDCGYGLVVQWSRSMGHGRYEGLVIRPEDIPKEVLV